MEKKVKLFEVSKGIGISLVGLFGTLFCGDAIPVFFFGPVGLYMVYSAARGRYV